MVQKLEALDAQLKINGSIQLAEAEPLMASKSEPEMRALPTSMLWEIV